MTMESCSITVSCLKQSGVAIKMLDVYQILLPYISPNCYWVLSAFNALYVRKESIHENIKNYSRKTFSGVLRGITSSPVKEPMSMFYTYVSS